MEADLDSLPMVEISVDCPPCLKFESVYVFAAMLGEEGKEI